MDVRSAALLSILSEVRRVRRSFDGWRDSEDRKAATEMTNADLRDVFAWIEASAERALSRARDRTEE